MSAASPLRVTLKPGRDKAARQRHPWVYSGAVASIAGEGPPGAVGDLVDAKGDFIARGFVNRGSQIVFRAVSFRREEVDRTLLAARLEAALGLRQRLLATGTEAYRLVNSEGDRLSGLVVDRYGPWLVVQIGSAGIERLKPLVVEVLAELLKPQGIYERSESPARRDEGLEPATGVLAGVAPPERITVSEAGLKLVVDLQHGQKTGLFLDQRPARLRVRELSRGQRVLDAFAYSGGFAVNALAGGAAHVVAVERQAPMLELLDAHIAANGLDGTRVEKVAGDVFRFLRDSDERFDLIVLDPPPFAKKKSEVDGACRGYKEIHREAFKRLEPGGLLLSSSCSQHVDPWLFQQLLFQASLEAGRQVQLVARSGQPEDHPVLLDHPEGEYLKVFFLRVL